MECVSQGHHVGYIFEHAGTIVVIFRQSQCVEYLLKHNFEDDMIFHIPLNLKPPAF